MRSYTFRQWNKKVRHILLTLKIYRAYVTSFLLGVLVTSFYFYGSSLALTRQHHKDYPPSKFLSNKIPKMAVDQIPIFRERRERLKAACNKWTGLTSEPNYNHTLASRRYKLFYCPVEKAGSTFWRRFMFQMEFTEPLRSPYDVDIIFSLTRMGFLRHPRPESVHFKDYLSYTSMLFVRDPYSRIFSAFVDKLLAPNPFYWYGWGVDSMIVNGNIPNDTRRQFRNKEIKQLPCGNGVTFPEFVNFVNVKGWKIDVHLKPVFRLCTPCSIRYDVIGKMDTFSDDVNHMVSILGLDKRFLRMEDFKKDTVDDAIQDSVRDSLSPGWLQHTLKCINKEEVVRRIWRKLQLRGVISWRIPFSLSKLRIENIRAEGYIEILKTANRNSKNSIELKLQKRQAILEAFSMVSSIQLDKFVRMYHADFTLFGFDSEAFRNKSMGKVKLTGAFDLTREWNLNSILNDHTL